MSGGEVRSFPTLDDYVEHYQQLGLIEDRRDLVENKNRLVSEVFYHWIRTLQTGCLFAARLARRPSEAGFQSFVFPRALGNPSLGADLSRILDLTAQEDAAAQLIFPDIDDEEGVVRLVNTLCRDSRWYWTDPGADDGDSEKSLIGLRWVLPGLTAVNHVLGFSPIPSMPFTRQAPFTGIVLRIREQKRTAPTKTENGLVQVHLADMDSGLSSSDQLDKFWNKTQEQKKLLVQSSLAMAARARVTFCVERRLASGLEEPTLAEVVEQEQVRQEPK